MKNAFRVSILDSPPTASMDDLERDKFYVAPPDSDGDEYELEAPDEAAEELRKQAVLNSIRSKIDIDEVYREAEHNRGGEILENWLRNFHFRFQFRVKHLLIATAVLAIALTLIKLKLFWMAVIVLFMLSVAGLYGYLKWEERKHQAEADRRREELYARRRAQFAPRLPGHIVGDPLAATESSIPDVPQPPNEVERIWLESMEREKFRFQFSLRELIIAMTTAAVVLGLIRLLGSPAATATVLGLVALFGLLIFALGFEPPQIVVFGWWFTLVLYVLLSIFAAVWSGFG